jgi:SecA-like ATPase subunit of protein translocation complex/PEP-CTERM motif-containing protein
MDGQRRAGRPAHQWYRQHLLRDIFKPDPTGMAYYASGFQDPLAAGTQTDWNEIFVTPYSFVEAGGINPDTANGFTFALHFTLQSPETPEPASAALLGAGLLTLVWWRRQAGSRFLNMRHFDVQLIGGIVLHRGAPS